MNQISEKSSHIDATGVSHMSVFKDLQNTLEAYDLTLESVYDLETVSRQRHNQRSGKPYGIELVDFFPVVLHSMVT